LGKVAHGRGELSLRTAKLLEHKISEAWICLMNPNSVLQIFIMNEHRYSFDKSAEIAGIYQAIDMPKERE
jgi:hypothetical protein